MYITPDELVQVVRDCQQTGRVSDRLAAVLRQMAMGLIFRFHYPVPYEDAVQEAVLGVCKSLHRIDTTGNLFAYLTTVVRNELLTMVERRHREARLIEGLAAGVRPDRRRGRPRNRPQD